MKTQIAAIKTRTTVGTKGKVDEQVYKAGFAAICFSSSVIGIWAVASLVGGMVAAGGPFALISEMFKAMLG